MVNCEGSPFTQIIKNNFPSIIVDKLQEGFLWETYHVRNTKMKLWNLLLNYEDFKESKIKNYFMQFWANSCNY